MVGLFSGIYRSNFNIGVLPANILFCKRCTFLHFFQFCRSIHGSMLKCWWAGQNKQIIQVIQLIGQANSKANRHIIYIRTVNSKLLFNIGIFDSFLAGLVWAEIECMLLCPKRPKNQFKPVLQSRQHALGAYCPNIYT